MLTIVDKLLCGLCFGLYVRGNETSEPKELEKQRRKILHIITERVNCEPRGITVESNIMQFEWILGDIFANRFMAPVSVLLLLWIIRHRMGKSAQSVW